MTTRRALAAVSVVLVAWIAIMAGVMRYSDVAPAAVALFPTASMLESLKEGTGILGLNRLALTVANRPGMASELYAGGAWLVLPAGLTGCLPLSKAQRSQL